jgi:predicted ABC-type ATPase
MNVDRLPDNGPRPAADTTPLTESHQPETAAPAKPKPERKHDQLPESPTATPHTDSPVPSGNTSEPAEPRSRQEHADPPSTDEREVSSDEVEDGDTTVADEADTPLDNLDTDRSSTDVPREEEKADSTDDRSADSSPDDLPPKERESSNDAEASEGLGRHDEEQAESGRPPNGEANNPSPNMQAEKPSEPATDAPVAHDRPPPLTDKEWSEHVTQVRDTLDKARAAGLTTDALYTVDPDRKEWIVERNRLQGSLVADLYDRASEVPCDHQAIIAGGLGGAGKTTVLTGQAGIDPSKYLIINPDDIKEEMAHRGMIPEVDKLSPMEASDLAHEESSYIAKRLALRAMAEGKNIIWDITMSSQESTEARINNLRDAGYERVEGVFVDIPPDISITRTELRHREGHEQWRSGQGFGGRFVPPEVIKRQLDTEWGSQNRRTYEAMKEKFVNWSIYDNSVHGRSPTLIDSSNQEKPDRTQRRGRHE